jgi:SRSO17 transposase
MVKPLPLFILAGLLAGCASEPEAEEVQRAPQLLQVSCYQANWQAETVPVIYKRGGQAALEKYEFMPNLGPVACR